MYYFDYGSFLIGLFVGILIWEILHSSIYVRILKSCADCKHDKCHKHR